MRAALTFVLCLCATMTFAAQAKKAPTADEMMKTINRTPRLASATPKLNTDIATYHNTGQFWKWTPDAFLAMPTYIEMKGKWAKP